MTLFGNGGPWSRPSENTTWGDVALGVGSGNLGSIFSAAANKSQINAADEALRRQIEEQRAIEQQRTEAGQQAQGILATQGMRGAGAIQDYNQQALGAVGQARDNSLAALYAGQQQGVGAAIGGTNDSLASLYAGQGAAAGVLGQGLQSGGMALNRAGIGAQQSTLQGTRGALGELGQGLADSRLAGLYQTDFSPSQDYAFRQQQGEQGINRMNAARGGRTGGAALKQLSDFGQGMAANEYGNWANRQQGIASNLDAQQTAAANQAAQYQSSSGQSLANQRQQIASGIAGLQAGYGNQLGSLYSQTGNQAAGIQQGLGSTLSGLYTSGGANASNAYGNAANTAASIYGNQGAQLANLYAGNAAGQANLLTGQQAQNAQLSAASLPMYQAPTQYAGQEQAAQAQAIKDAGANAALMALYANNRYGG